MNKLVAQLKRELKRSPAKAAALGGGLLLAIWFWLPLLGEWFGGEASATSAVAPQVPPQPTASAVVAESSREAARGTKLDWRQLEAWQQSSSYARSYVWHEGMYNPFDTTEETEHASEVDLAEAEAAQVQEVTEEVVKQQRAAALSSLQVTSTLIMPGQRAATINGKVYREGESIDLSRQHGETAAPNGLFSSNLDSGEQSPNRPMEMAVVRRIGSDTVLLEFGDTLYPLPLTHSTSGTIQLELR